MQSDFPFVGDIDGMRSINLDMTSNLRIHEDNVPFLNFGDGSERCCGARLIRFNRKTVAAPCFEQRLDSGGAFCAHCVELFAFSDDRGCFKLMKKKMENATSEYKAGKSVLYYIVCRR